MIQSCESKFLQVSLYLYVVMPLVPLLAKWQKLNWSYNSSENYECLEIGIQGKSWQ